MLVIYYICSFMSLDQQDMDLYETFEINLWRNLAKRMADDSKQRFDNNTKPET